MRKIGEKLTGCGCSVLEGGTEQYLHVNGPFCYGFLKGCLVFSVGLSELRVDNPILQCVIFFSFLHFCNTFASAGVYCCTTRSGSRGTVPEFEVLHIAHFGLSNANIV